MRRRPWAGYGLWRVPNFFQSVRIDASQLGVATAAELHFRRLTIERGARKLQPAHGGREGRQIPVYFMSGREHWAMTAFCACSLLSATNANLIPHVMDDGSLGAREREELARVLPQVKFLDRAACDEKVEESLPRARFPALHAMRAELPLMRKLMDLHAGQTGWRLFLDSDMLFFREPEWMLRWLEKPDAPVYMRDYQNSYGYSPEVLRSVLGQMPAPMVNTGFCGLHSERADWDELERWAGMLRAAEGTNHFSEQCLTAMMMTAHGGVAAPRDYQILPSKQESRKPEAVMLHYVAESRTWYHIYGWPGVLRRTVS